MTTKLNELLDAVEHVQAMAGRLRTEPHEITVFTQCVKVNIGWLSYSLHRLCNQCLSSEDLREVVICRAECIERVLEELESLDPHLFENYGDEETCLTFVEALKEVKNEN